MWVHPPNAVLIEVKTKAKLCRCLGALGDGKPVLISLPQKRQFWLTSGPSDLVYWALKEGYSSDTEIGLWLIIPGIDDVAPLQGGPLNSGKMRLLNTQVPHNHPSRSPSSCEGVPMGGAEALVLRFISLSAELGSITCDIFLFEDNEVSVKRAKAWRGSGWYYTARQPTPGSNSHTTAIWACFPLPTNGFSDAHKRGNCLVHHKEALATVKLMWNHSTGGVKKSISFWLFISKLRPNQHCPAHMAACLLMFVTSLLQYSL